ncbi:fluoride efflux transporter CrcB [Desulfovulcanus sp.]
MSKIILLGLSGGLGAISRYYIAGLVQNHFNSTYPFGTMAVNLLGCLAFGFIWAFLEDKLFLSPSLRLYVLTGFMGAFTTFSTFSFETANLIRYSQWLWAMLNLVGQNILGISLIFLGMFLARIIRP